MREDLAEDVVALVDTARRLRNARRRLEEFHVYDEENLGASAGDVTFGAVSFESMDAILETAAAMASEDHRGGSFVDVGSGAGTFVLAAALTRDADNFAQACGIELEPSLAAYAAEALRLWASTNDDPRSPTPRCVCGDACDGVVLRAWLPDASVCYSCWTLFPSQVRTRLVDLFAAHLCAGAVVVVLSHGFSHPRFRFEASTVVRCSWSDAVPAFFYRVLA